MAGKKETKKERTADRLSLTLEAVERQFGKGSIMRLGDGASLLGMPVIKSGLVGLNLALGVGGYPKGRIVEIYGPESSGKTTLAMHGIAECQKAGGIAAFIDAEHALDPIYARNLGIKIEDLLFSQPTTGEEALEIADMLVKSGAVDLIVIDSVAALVPRAELEGEMGDTHVGLQARLMSQALRKLTGTLHKSQTCLIFINQIRMKIGVMFGSPETTSGGNALKFYASQRLDVRRIASIKDKDRAMGSRTRVRVVKNKVSAPFRTVEFDIMYGLGMSYEGDLLDLAVDRSLVQKSGSWFSYNGDRIGQGRENSKQWLLEHPEVGVELERKILEIEGMLPSSVEAATPQNGDSATSIEVH
jgi:recombination protein RecA